jgi:peptidyl-prolyl cis-trans isomerase D
MQIIQNIREKGTAIVIVVIALSLIGFILMDAKSGGKTSLFGSSSTTNVGEVNGEPIEYKDFTDKVKQTEDQYGGRVSGNQIYEVRQSVWDQLVAEKVIIREFKKLGLSFSPKEMSAIMFSSDAPYTLKQAFTDKQTGQYDINKVQEWWKTAKKSKDEQRAAIESQIIEPMKLQTLYSKYNGMIAASAYYPTWMQKKDYAERNQFANISYVGVPYNVINDNDVKVSDAEIIEYINKKSSLYKQDGGRFISYVSFSANPTANDSLKAKESIEALKAPFISDTNANNFLARNMSTIKYFDGYSLRSKMAMVQKDTIAALSIGNVYGPYLDGGSYVLAKMLGNRQMPDSVRARTILVSTRDLQTGQPTIADSIAKKRIDSISIAIKGGADFNSMVLQYSDDKVSKDKGGAYDFSSIQFQNLPKEFSEVVFYGTTGDKKIVHSDIGWYYIEVISQKNFETAYKVAYMSKQILATDETVNNASMKATKLSGENRDIKSLAAYVTKNGIQKIDVPTMITQNEYRLGLLQDARQLIRWAFEAKAGDVSEPFSIEDQFVVAAVTKVQAEGLPDASTARPLVETFVRKEKKAAIIKEKLSKANSLETATSIYNQPIRTAGEDSTLTLGSQIINGIGDEPKVIGAAFNKNFQTKISEPISGNGGVFLVKVNNIGGLQIETAENTAIQTAEQTRGILQKLSAWFESLKKTADIKDYRNKQF